MFSKWIIKEFYNIGRGCQVPLSVCFVLEIGYQGIQEHRPWVPKLELWGPKKAPEWGQNGAQETPTWAKSWQKWHQGRGLGPHVENETKKRVSRAILGSILGLIFDQKTRQKQEWKKTCILDGVLATFCPIWSSILEPILALFQLWTAKSDDRVKIWKQARRLDDCATTKATFFILPHTFTLTKWEFLLKICTALRREARRSLSVQHQ